MLKTRHSMLEGWPNSLGDFEVWDRARIIHLQAHYFGPLTKLRVSILNPIDDPKESPYPDVPYCDCYALAWTEINERRRQHGIAADNPIDNLFEPRD